MSALSCSFEFVSGVGGGWFPVITYSQPNYSFQNLYHGAGGVNNLELYGEIL